MTATGRFRRAFTQTRRAYIYRCIVAAGAVALAYGIIDSNDLAVWLGLAAVVLNVMPVANTPIRHEE